MASDEATPCGEATATYGEDATMRGAAATTGVDLVMMDGDAAMLTSD